MSIRIVNHAVLPFKLSRYTGSADENTLIHLAEQLERTVALRIDQMIANPNVPFCHPYPKKAVSNRLANLALHCRFHGLVASRLDTWVQETVTQLHSGANPSSSPFGGSAELANWIYALLPDTGPLHNIFIAIVKGARYRTIYDLLPDWLPAPVSMDVSFLGEIRHRLNEWKDETNPDDWSALAQFACVKTPDIMLAMAISELTCWTSSDARTRPTNWQTVSQKCEPAVRAGVFSVYLDYIWREVDRCYMAKSRNWALRANNV